MLDAVYVERAAEELDNLRRLKADLMRLRDEGDDKADARWAARRVEEAELAMKKFVDAFDEA